MYGRGQKNLILTDPGGRPGAEIRAIGRNSHNLVYTPLYCTRVKVPPWANRLQYRMAVLAWWNCTVPRSRQTRQTDILASLVLECLSHDPEYTVRNWIATRDSRPWLSAEKGMEYLRRLDLARSGLA